MASAGGDRERVEEVEGDKDAAGPDGSAAENRPNHCSTGTRYVAR